jgi:predicted O-methyltransferase YrrM
MRKETPTKILRRLLKQLKADRAYTIVGGLLLLGFALIAIGILVATDPTLIIAGLLLWSLSASLAFYLNIRLHLNQLHKSHRALLSAISITQLNPQEPTTFLTHAAHPDFIELVLEAVRRQRPNSILELGSGSSSRYILAYLQRVRSEARMISLEDDAQWATLVQGELDRLNTSQAPLHIVQHAPLVADGGRQVYQYDAATLQASAPFDLVVVDGPHRVEDRVHFLSTIQDQLTDDVVMIFDDGNTAAIRTAMQHYKQDGWQVRYYNTYKGTWFMWRGDALAMSLP